MFRRRSGALSDSPFQSDHDRLAASEGTVHYVAPTSDTLPPSFGPGPSGTMEIDVLPNLECPGFEGGTIQITYTIPSGVQQSYQPNPGVAYDKIKRLSYIPNTPEGRCLLTRYRYAFDHGFMFVIGYSVTFKKENVVTWAKVLNKTSLKPGEFGYPDSNYIDKANAELDKLNLPKADAILILQGIVEGNDTEGIEAVANFETKEHAATEPDISLFATSVASGTAAVDLDSPYLMPQLPNLSTLVAPNDWILSASDAKRCTVLAGAVSETNRLRQLKIPILAAENTVFIYSKELEDKGLTAIQNDLSSLRNVVRAMRSLLLTAGSVQLKALPFLKRGIFAKDRNIDNIKLALLNMRALHVSGNVVIIAYQESETVQRERYALYQTPDLSRFLEPLVAATVAAYVGVPNWAIPIQWSGDLPHLAPVSEQSYREWLGADGGFSSSMYSAAVAYLVKQKLPIGELKTGRAAIEKTIFSQQPTRSFSLQGHSPHLIDLPALSKSICSENKEMQSMLVRHGLHALAFNLVFRSLRLAKYEYSLESTIVFQEALARLLLYNVTIREVRFVGTRLTDFGEIIGRSWAMNAQPLISKIDFSGCGLTGRDLRGLLPGLARIWCGGTAFAESIAMRENHKIPTATWDQFFTALVDPTTVPFWTQAPPPSPNLTFLQELDLVRTPAVGPGLAGFLKKCSGLRKFRLSAGDPLATKQVLEALILAECPIETLHGEKLASGCSNELLCLANSLKSLALVDYEGDASPLMCSWPQPVPNLTVVIKGNLSCATVSTPVQGHAFSPGSLSITNDSGFVAKAVRALSAQAIGLKHLSLFQATYGELAEAAPVLALCGLETLEVHPKKNTRSTVSASRLELFWSTMAASRTIREVIIPNQLSSTVEIAMIGHFLKSNRSVAKIQFDSSFTKLDVESVKVLRSAFYGNKKVVDLEYLSKSQTLTMTDIRNKTQQELAEVQMCKAEIKKLFKMHYSKYNHGWRATPNRLKEPYVDRIRVAKRKIGQMEGDSRKIAQLLDEIKSAVLRNRAENARIKQEKDATKLSRRENQFTNLAAKKRKILANLITRLHRAKKRGRQNKSAKTQVPRSTYYSSRMIWPSSCSKHHGVHSYYHYYNDPYWTRFHCHYGFYSEDVCAERDAYLNDDRCNDGDTRGATACQWFINDQIPVYTDSLGHVAGTRSPFFDDVLSQVGAVFPQPSDPWTNIDDMICGNVNTLYSAISTPAYLAEIHSEACELGADVVADISQTLDDAAALDSKLDDIADSTAISREVINDSVHDSLDPGMDFTIVQSTLDDLPDFTIDTGADDAAQDADDAVNMYAGAGPRDLDDGGASFGSSGTAALAGARRRAHTRKINRRMVKVLYIAGRRVASGYKSLNLLPEERSTLRHHDGSSDWPDDVLGKWIRDTRTQQVIAMSKSNLFPLPQVSRKEPKVLSEWSSGLDKKMSYSDIQVILVTQCSLDRLGNLEAQLASWRGRASVAVYLKPEEDLFESKKAILAAIEKAKQIASHTREGPQGLEVAISVVEGCEEDDVYPINYLRNIALLEAQRQHLRFKSLDTSAILLVDVDFRPSNNLHELLHTPNASDAILVQRRVVVCPAFESFSQIMGSACPATVDALLEGLDSGNVEGFHISHFPQGHGPTNFDRFCRESIRCDPKNTRTSWERLYKIKYEKLFEPYVCMAATDIPLYDERFRGYGLNKVSHLASIAKQKNGDFFVLPGAFLVAPIHERSKSWADRYSSDEKKFSQLWLKGLYSNFTSMLEKGLGPVVCERVRLKQLLLGLQEKQAKRRNHLLFVGSNEESTNVVPTSKGHSGEPIPYISIVT